MTDYKQLCAELIEIWDNTSDFDYNDFGNAAKDLVIRARAALAEPEPEPEGPTDEELWQVGDEDFRANTWPTDAIRYARAVLARWGRPAPVPAEGELVELVAELRGLAEYFSGEMYSSSWIDQLNRAADLLKRQAAPVPVASNTRYEFSVLDEDYTEQAGGTAPSYAQALSEGQHYLAQYQQDGPHTLEVRRVENLNPGAFPVPDDAPVAVLPEDAQVIEPTERTILVPTPQPVAVSERPWEREGWCHPEERWAWFYSWRVGWRDAIPPESLKPPTLFPYTHSVPFNALPLPTIEE